MTDVVRSLLALVLLVAVATSWTMWASTGEMTPEREYERQGEALLSLFQVQRIDADHAVLTKGGRRFLVEGLPADVVVGEELSVGAIPQDGVWQARWVTRHPLRPAKRVLGFVGLFVTAGLLAVSVRIRDRRVWFRG